MPTRIPGSNPHFWAVNQVLMIIQPYLTFAGHCEEAMRFYQECLGGDLTLQKIGDSPLAGKMPAAMKNKILHATLRCGATVIMGSDMVGDKGIRSGNNVSLMLGCSSEEETRACYKRLSEGGEAAHPLHITFWGALFGDLVDKFGNQWLLHFDEREAS